MPNFRNLKFVILLVLGILSVYSILHKFNIPSAQAAQTTNKKTITTDLVVDNNTNDFNGNTYNLFEETGSLTFDTTDFSPSTANNTMVVFIANNLTIKHNIIHPDQNSGIVFVVKGNVNIHKDVTQIDAVIISEGIICTAFDGTNCLDGTTVTPKLTINGSIISLNLPDVSPDPRCTPTITETCPLKFVRNLADNTTAAEVINYQPKYLVILRDLFSDTFQKWSEIDALTPLPSPSGSFSCSQYNGTGEENEKLCSLSGCKRCSGDRCMPSGGSCT